MASKRIALLVAFGDGGYRPPGRCSWRLGAWPLACCVSHWTRSKHPIFSLTAEGADLLTHCHVLSEPFDSFANRSQSTSRLAQFDRHCCSGDLEADGAVHSCYT